MIVTLQAEAFQASQERAKGFARVFRASPRRSDRAFRESREIDSNAIALGISAKREFALSLFALEAARQLS